jgi:SpoVK/Ycf46/Vps4 family AAA+-type ATPase
MSFMSEMTSGIIKGEDVVEVELLPDLEETCTLMVRTCEYFFKGRMKMSNAPFKGFILEGPPGTGKTEVVKQVARRLDKILGKVYLMLVDGASIAAPKWGEAERKLRDVFSSVGKLDDGSKMVVIFDDIESLMISRGVDLAKEWHYSINSILFHELDRLDPYETIVCATSNRIDLVDEAIKTRLYPILAPPVPLDQLESIVDNILDSSEMSSQDRGFVREMIMKELSDLENPTIRDARQIAVVECIKNGVWSA